MSVMVKMILAADFFVFSSNPSPSLIVVSETLDESFSSAINADPTLIFPR